jgi:glycerophosphoryl diester phosphodiesterase
MHDETVDRTTDGRGLVADLTLAELETLDAGSWKDERFAGERIPTLAQALSAANGKGRLLLDVPVDGMGSVIADVLRSLKLPFETAFIATWSDGQRVDMKKHVPGATIVQADAVPWNWDAGYFARQRAAGVRLFDLDIANWSVRFQSEARGHGMDVWTWTINDEDMMRRLMLAGADGFETDNPEAAIRIARELGVRD